MTIASPVQEPGAGFIVPGLRERIRRRLLGRDAALFLLLIAIWVLGAIAVPGFAAPNTLYFLLLDVLPVLLMALPLTLIMITGEVDLSVASMLGLASVTVGLLYSDGWPLPVAALAALLVGAVGGAVNGLLVAGLRLPSLAITIGSLALFRGIAVGLLDGTSVTGFPAEYTGMIAVRLFGPGTPVPAVLAVFLVLAAAFVIVLHFSPAGRAIYGSGLNREAARFSGVRVDRMKFWLYVASGVLAALAGVYWTLRYNTARGDNGLGLELTVLAAVLLGGVSIFGGRGALPGVIAGVLVIGTLQSLLRFADVSSQMITVATGALLVLSVAIPGLLGRLRARPSRQ